MSDIIFEKKSDTEFKSIETKPVEKIYNITDLKNDRAIYVAHLAEYQAKIDAVDILIAKAESLGILEKGEDI